MSMRSSKGLGQFWLVCIVLASTACDVPFSIAKFFYSDPGPPSGTPDGWTGPERFVATLEAEYGAGIVPDQFDIVGTPLPSPTGRPILLWTVYEGDFTSVLSRPVTDNTRWDCSENPEYWHKVIFTFELNADFSVTNTGLAVDGETLTGGPWKTYRPIENNQFLYETDTETGRRREILTFSFDQLVYVTQIMDDDGSTGECSITLEAKTD